ncbi:MAG: Lrp/AsnC family transcriptional regulator [Nanoarchaeota archaeon]|nr:Lrp/AsnC family transcriptional regulator [Nanoarchaeota archaeon]
MSYEMDEKDLKILDILKQHGDYTTRQIAKKTLLPPTTIHNRIRKLKQEGIIRRFTVDVDQDMIGRGLLVYVMISANLAVLKQKKRSQYDIANELRKFGFIERADIVSGGTDLVVMVRVKDVAEFDNVLLNKIQLIEGIEKTQSLIVIHGK